MKQKEVITKADSILWGFISLIPFGWIILWGSINKRRSEAEKGIRTQESAKASITNYAVGAGIGLFVSCVAAASLSNGETIVIPNIVAVVILLWSTIHNISRINNIGEKTEEVISQDAEETDEEADEEVTDYNDYEKEIKLVKKRLESVNTDDSWSEIEMADIRKDINKLISKYKDAEFIGGGKYKLYELRAEYYFVAGNKEQAEKYIKQAIKIRKQEKEQLSSEEDLL